MSGVEYVVLGHKEDRCLITWRDQSEWGYILVDLINMAQLPVEFTYPYPTVSPPDFSADDKYVVSCNPVQRGWQGQRI